jgi:hypothetical protein
VIANLVSCRLFGYGPVGLAAGTLPTQTFLDRSNKEISVLKKAGAAVAIAGAFLGIGSTALADAPELDITDQVGVADLNDSEVASDLNACFIDVNVIAVPVLSDNDSGLCANPDDK